MSKFAHCHESNGLMWCQHFNGSWAPPFLATRTSDRKEVEVEKENTISSEEETAFSEKS